MKNICFLLVLFVSPFLSLLAQDKDEVAKALYAKAESSYTSEKYDEALKYLNDCENTLGSTNSKILYLKINILNNIYSKNGEHLSGLKFALDKFFEVTDKSVYPAEKYSDIVNIKIELADKIKEQEQMQVEYIKLKKSTSASEFESFFKKYPASSYEAELRIIYDKLQSEQIVFGYCDKLYPINGLCITCLQLDLITQKNIVYNKNKRVCFQITLPPEVNVFEAELYIEYDGKPWYPVNLKAFNNQLKRGNPKFQWSKDGNGNYTLNAILGLDDIGVWEIELHDKNGRSLGSNSISISK